MSLGWSLRTVVPGVWAFMGFTLYVLFHGTL